MKRTIKVVRSISEVLMTIFLVLAIWQFAILLMNGFKVLGDKEYLPVVRGLLKRGEDTDRIIFTGGGADEPYIGKLSSQGPLTSYYIEDIGLIPRWSKMDKEIRHWIDSCENVREERIKSIR